MKQVRLVLNEPCMLGMAMQYVSLMKCVMQKQCLGSVSGRECVPKQIVLSITVHEKVSA